MTKSTKNMALFFERYQTFSQEWESEYLQRLQADYGRFKLSLTEILKEAEEKDRKIASKFNIFYLLGVANYEVNTHSAFLGNLLNPAGTHAQKYLFLDAFLQICADKYEDKAFAIPPNRIQNSYWRIEREKWTRYGRLDLVISNSKLSFLMVIENKIYASEQDDQLSRYAEWLNSQKTHYKQQALIYLTPEGNKSDNAGDHLYFRMSYHEHIYYWLDCARVNIEAPRIREIVRQYMEIIEQL